MKEFVTKINEKIADVSGNYDDILMETIKITKASNDIFVDSPSNTPPDFSQDPNNLNFD